MQVGPGTRALITGASRGIGRALAEALAARGAVVGLLARSSREVESLAAALPGGRHIALPADVGRPDEVEAATGRFVADAGGLELVVANAGIAHYGPFRDQDLAEIERMTTVNWLGTIHTVRAGLPHLLERAHGHIVVISSGAALRSFPWAAVYGATKAAQRNFASALRHELSGTGVSLTTVYPGEIATSFHDHEKASLPDWHRGGPDALPAADLAARILAAVEADHRELYVPPVVRLLGIAQGISPALADRILRLLRGGSAAPRRD